MKTVLVTSTNYSQYCGTGKKLLEESGCKIIENPYGRPYTFEELKPIVGEIDAVVCGVDTWDEAVFALSPRLKVIARFGVGVDNIDLAAAKAHGVRVTNCPGVNSSAVAEQAMALMLAVVRQVPRLNASVRENKWERLMFHELRGKTVGLLGFGAIARFLAKKLSGFEVNLMAYDPYPNEAAAKELGVRLATMDQVLAESDILSLHLPSLPETRHTIHKETLAKMKDGAILINTSRGPIVDEAAVAEALKSGKLAGMGTDVFETEPAKPDNPLFLAPNCVASPHTATETYENYDTTSVLTARAILDVFAGIQPQNLLNG